MYFGTIEAPTMKELFVQRVEDMILSGKLKIGDKLPTERELADECGISRSVVHSGLTELVKAGFLRMVPRKGVFVENYHETGSLECLNAILRHSGGRLRKKEVQSILDARIAIEGTSLRMVTENHTEEDIKVLEKIIADAEAFAATMSDYDYAEMADKLYMFSHRICVLSGNNVFPLIYNEFKPLNLAFWEKSVRMFGAERNIHLLKRYLTAIKNSDAEDAYNRLIKSTQEFFASYEE